MTNNLLLAAVLTAVAGSASYAQSPSPPPAPAAADPAKVAYQEGLNHYNLGEFDLAIASFRKAYAISSAPGLLFNIAQSFRLKKDYEQASYFYKTYLRLKPDAQNRADVEVRVKEMDDLLEQQKGAPTGTVTPDGNSKNTPGGQTPAKDETPKDATPPKDPSVTVNLVAGKTTQADNPGQPMITAGIATAGVGGALLITGFVFGGLASSAAKDLDGLSTNMGTWTQDQQDKYDAGHRNNTIATISFIAGGAALVTGGTLWFLGRMKNEKATVAVIPSKTGTTVAVGWSF